MALGKKRGRKPKKETVLANDVKKMNRYWLDCHVCGMDGAEVDGDITRFTCGRCAQIGVPAPVLPKTMTSEEKKARKERSKARKERKEAIARGEIVPQKSAQALLGFGRGWHRKILFEVEVEGKTRYFSKGKELTKTQFTKLTKTQNEKNEKGKKPSSGWGRGWHLKDTFVSPEGDYYESGSLIEPGHKTPTVKELETEFEALMIQHVVEVPAPPTFKYEEFFQDNKNG